MMDDNLSRRLHEYATSTETSVRASTPDVAQELRIVGGRARRRRALRGGAAGLVAAAVVGGGVLGAGAVDLSASPTIRPAGNGTTAPAPTPEVGTDDEQTEADVARGPLDEFLARRSVGVDPMADEDARQHLIAECMDAAGFTYIAYSEADGKAVTIAPEREPGTVEYATLYGYGHSIPAPQESFGNTSVDPNEAIVAELSESELAAYRLALYGEARDEEWDRVREPDGPLHGDAVGPMSAEDGAGQGCEGEAFTEIPVADVDFEEEFSGLLAARAGLHTAAMRGPRGKALDAAWSRCMAEAGHDGLEEQPDAYTRALEVTQEIDARALALVGIDAQGIWDIDPEEMTQAMWQELADAREPYLEPLRGPEIDLAVADATCVDEVRYWDVVQEIEWDLQQQLLDENRGDLEAWFTDRT